MTRIRWVVAVVSAVIIGLGAVLAVALSRNDHVAKNPLPGHLAPTFALTDFNGTPLRLADFRGKVVVLNYWNEWCEPCLAETPLLVGLAQAHQGDPDFAMIGVAHDERSKNAARDYSRASKMDYSLAFDPESRTALDYSVTGQPETFVIDKQGVVRSWISGPIDPQSLDAVVTKLEQL